jgi:hypothetical protein
MKTSLRCALVLLATVTAAAASGGVTHSAPGLLLYLFLGFGALILACQLAPAMILFGAMVHSLFAAPSKTARGDHELEISG